MTARTLVLTRPLAQAWPWLDALRSMGIHDVATLPTMAIDITAQRVELEQAWAALVDPARTPHCVAFVSPSAVQAWFAARPEGVRWPSAVEAAAPGPGTARALHEHGVVRVTAPDRSAASYDSHALWAMLEPRDWTDARAWIIHGGIGRDTLAKAWRAAGARVSHWQAYVRCRAEWSDDDVSLWQRAVRAPLHHVWLFTSAEALQNLLVLSKHHGQPSEQQAGLRLEPSNHVALCTHEAIARVATQEGFGRVRVCPPDPASIAHALRDMDGTHTV